MDCPSPSDPIPTDTPEHAEELAERLESLIDARAAMGEAVDSAGWRDSLIDAATRQMADGRGVDAKGLVADREPTFLDPVVADWPPYLWDDPHALGWLHEQYAARARRDSFAQHVHGEQKHDNATTTTQLYTPRWVADVLARHALQYAPGKAPDVLDPAVGAGQMLLAALAVFAERAPEADPAAWIRPLWGNDLDARVVDVAHRTIALEIARTTGRRSPRAESICRRQITRGDGLADGIEPRAVVLTNPPYMGRRSMPDELRERIEPFRPYHRDLFSAFIARCHQLADHAVGILAQQSIWYLRRFEKARRDLLERGRLALFLHLGAGAFWNLDGEKASVVAFVQQIWGEDDSAGPQPSRLFDLRDWSGPTDQRRAYERAIRPDENSSGHDEPAARWFDVETTRFVPGRPICHDLSDELRALFDSRPPLEEFAEVPSQNKTGRNRRYVRRWDDIDPDQLRRVDALGGRGTASGRWVFYSKGGRFAPWWGNWQWVVDWSGEARQFYRDNRTSSLLDEAYWFRQGIVYTDFGGQRFNARWMPPGCVFDMTGPAIFPRDCWWPTLEESQRLGAALAVLNSSPARRMLKALNPTLHFQVRDVRGLPLPVLNDEDAADVATDVWQLVNGVRRLHAGIDDDPLCDPPGDTPQPPADDEYDTALERLAAIEASIDRRICRAYGVEYQPLENASLCDHHAL